MNKRSPVTVLVTLDESGCYSKYKVPGIKDKTKEYLPIITDGSVIQGNISVLGKNDICILGAEIRLIGEVGPIQRPLKMIENVYKVPCNSYKANKRVDIPFNICCSCPWESYYGSRGVVRYSLVAYVKRLNIASPDCSPPKEVYVWRPEISTKLYGDQLNFPISITFPFGINYLGVARRVHFYLPNSKLATDDWIDGYVLIHDEYKREDDTTVITKNDSFSQNDLTYNNNNPSSAFSQLNDNLGMGETSSSNTNNIAFNTNSNGSNAVLTKIAISKANGEPPIENDSGIGLSTFCPKQLQANTSLLVDHELSRKEMKEFGLSDLVIDTAMMFSTSNDNNKGEVYDEGTLEKMPKQLSTNCQEEKSRIPEEESSFENEEIIYSSENSRVSCVVSDQQHFPITSIVLELVTVELVNGAITYRNNSSWEICNMNPQPNVKIPVRIPLRPLDLTPTISAGKNLTVFHRIGIIVTFIDPNDKKEKSLTNRGQIYIYRPAEDLLIESEEYKSHKSYAAKMIGTIGSATSDLEQQISIEESNSSSNDSDSSLLL